MGSFAEYESYDALGLAALVREGAVSAGEVLDSALERAERHEPQLNAIVHRFDDVAREAIRNGLPDGPFRGVPLLLKNTGLELAGTILSTGSRLFEGNVSASDWTLSVRHRAAGFVPFGKTNTPEFALSFTTEPLASGPTRNPWDLSRSPGGSSGGSAAAVAAGYVPMAHSSDGAGSIREPASHCGLFGLKPSRMLVTIGPALLEAIAGLSSPHAISRSVRDSAAMLDATAGPEVGDPYACPLPERPFLSEVGADPGRLRIGFTPYSPLGTPVDADCARVVQEAASLCESLGHHVEEAEPFYDAEALKSAWRVIAGVSNALLVEGRARAIGVADPLSLLEPVNAEWIAEGRALPATAYLNAVNTLHRTARALGRFFRRYDILLSPAVAEPAPILGEMSGERRSLDAFYDRFWSHAPFTCVFNAAGAPAMSVPLGTSRLGLPVGVQFGAAFAHDALLFRLAGQLEAAAPWAAQRPPAPFRSAA